jgi:hypothetical protein
MGENRHVANAMASEFRWAPHYFRCLSDQSFSGNVLVVRGNYGSINPGKFRK